MITQLLPFLKIRQPSQLHRRLKLTKRLPGWREFDASWIAWYPGEVAAYTRDKFYEAPCTVLELDGDEQTLAAICSGIDLMLGRWRYLVERQYYWQQDATGLGGPAPPKPALYGLTEKRAQRLAEICQLLLRNKKESRRDRVGIRLWHAACHALGIESIMGGIPALEALLLGSTGDMRLRLALRAAGAVAKQHRREVFRHVYSAYGLRNKFIHGEEIPEIGRQEHVAFVEALTRVVNVWFQTNRPAREALEATVIPWLAEKELAPDGF